MAKLLKGVAVLVTGAAGSLGSATAKKLVSEGYKVAMMDLPDSNGLELAEILGENALFCPGDVTSVDDVEKALEATTNKLGTLRTVVNCAGVHRAAEIYNCRKDTPLTLSHVEEVWRVNVLGTLNVIRLAARYLTRNPVEKNDLRGLVVNTSGFAATDGQSGQVALSAAWGAIESMTLPLCREFGDRGVRVMTISPGLMESNLTGFLTPRILQSFSVLTPSPKRLGHRDEYADLVLAIMKNEFLNGEVIRLNGGLRLSF